MQTKAKLSYLRMSPKKVRLVVDVIRGMKVEEAVNQLNFLNKAAKRPILKLLNSAINNAENNQELKRDNLFIKEIRVDQAGMLKRWLPRAHGRATPIRKRMSHVSIILDELVPTKPKKKKESKKEKAVKVSSLDEVKKDIPAKEVESTKKGKLASKDIQQEKDQEVQDVRMEGKHRHQQHQDKRQMKKSGGFMKKIFNRKSG